MDSRQVGYDAIGKGRCTLPKRERLCGRNDIGRLFAHGEAFLAYPIKCTYLFRPAGEEEGGNRIMVIVPKRNHRRAVARNRLKRRMREAYRLNKHRLGEGGGKNTGGVDIAFSYIAKGEPAEYGTIEKAVVSILDKLCAIRSGKISRAGGPASAK